MTDCGRTKERERERGERRVNPDGDGEGKGSEEEKPGRRGKLPLIIAISMLILGLA